MTLVDVPSKYTAEDIKDALRRRHGGELGSEWVCVDEAFSGFASAGGGIDLLAVGAWKTAKVPGLRGAGKIHRDYRARDAEDWQEIDARNPIVAYEVKVSRSDFSRELYGYEPGPGASRRARGVPKWPHKARYALDRSHYFVFAVPRALLHDDEIARRTPWSEYDMPRRGALYLPEGVGLVEIDGRGCHVRAAADLRQPRPWTRHETHELLRRAAYRAFSRGHEHGRREVRDAA